MDSEAAAAAGWPGTEPRDWIPEMRQTDGTLEPPSSLSPRCSRRTGGMVEIRYALLDSRRYPAMYLPYQLSLSPSLSLPLIPLRFLVSPAALPYDFVAEIMRLIRSRRARSSGETSRTGTIDC